MCSDQDPHAAEELSVERLHAEGMFIRNDGLDTGRIKDGTEKRRLVRPGTRRDLYPFVYRMIRCHRASGSAMILPV